MDWTWFRGIFDIINQWDWIRIGSIFEITWGTLLGAAALFYFVHIVLLIMKTPMIMKSYEKTIHAWLTKPNHDVYNKRLIINNFVCAISFVCMSLGVLLGMRPILIWVGITSIFSVNLFHMISAYKHEWFAPNARTGFKLAIVMLAIAVLASIAGGIFSIVLQMMISGSLW